MLEGPRLKLADAQGDSCANVTLLNSLVRKLLIGLHTGKVIEGNAGKAEDP